MHSALSSFCTKLRISLDAGVEMHFRLKSLFISKTVHVYDMVVKKYARFTVLSTTLLDCPADFYLIKLGIRGQVAVCQIFSK